jgi:hypothetical protein
MTRMEKLADWISGVVYGPFYLSLCRKYEDICHGWARLYGYVEEDRDRHEATLRAIIAATDNGKSGTARKINRMAREGLE